MAEYLCPCQGDSDVHPATWFLVLRRTHSWHGREALHPKDFGDHAYACCDRHLPAAMEQLADWAEDMNTVVQVRRVNRGS